MLGAMKDVRDGKMSINRYVTVYVIPRATLKDCLSSRVEHSTKPGPKAYLNQEKEESLATRRLHY